MAAKVVKKSKQPEADPQLKEEVHEAVEEAADEAKTGNVVTADEPDASINANLNPDELHLRDSRPE